MRSIFDDAEKLYLFEATEDAEWRRKGQGRWCRRDRLAKLPRGAVVGPQRQQQGVVVAAAHGARNAASSRGRAFRARRSARRRREGVTTFLGGPPALRRGRFGRVAARRLTRAAGCGRHGEWRRPRRWRLWLVAGRRIQRTRFLGEMPTVDHWRGLPANIFLQISIAPHSAERLSGDRLKSAIFASRFWGASPGNSPRGVRRA